MPRPKVQKNPMSHLFESPLSPHGQDPRGNARGDQGKERHLRRMRQDHRLPLQLKIAHEDSHRREAVFVRQVREELLQVVHIGGSQKDTYERAAVRVQSVQ